MEQQKITKYIPNEQQQQEEQQARKKAPHKKMQHNNPDKTLPQTYKSNQRNKLMAVVLNLDGEKKKTTINFGDPSYEFLHNKNRKQRNAWYKRQFFDEITASVDQKELLNQQVQNQYDECYEFIKDRDSRGVTPKCLTAVYNWFPN